MAAEKIDALQLDINAKLTTENLDKLITSLGKLSKSLDKVNAKKVSDEVKKTGDAAEDASKKADKLTNSFMNQAVKITALIAVYRKLGDWISTGIEKSMSYVENLNLFTVSLGEYAQNAEKYGNTVKEALGIDPSNWIRTQGVFNTLIKGFGVAGDQAAYMSQNLTQLTYDIASFYNISIADAEKKLESAVAGELEPVRRLGYDLSQNKLTQIAQDPRYYGRTTYSINEETGALEANSVALDKNTRRTIANFNELTQGEKVQLRYIALMTQVTQAQGDMARTLNDPANQMRIFKEQLSITARELGNVFIPALNQVLPYLTAFAQLAGEAFRSLANFFGFEIPDMSSRMDVGSAVSGYDDIADNTGRAANNAKKLKDYMLGIDELNVFRPDEPKTGGGGGGYNPYALGASYKTPGYDFLSSAIKSSVEQAKKDLELLRKDFKEHPLQVSWEIFSEGAGELGSKIWEHILGMTPEELALQAQKNGSTVGQEFARAFFDKLASTKIAQAQVPIWEAIFGDATSLGVRAAQSGKDVGEQFFGEIVLAGLKAINNPVFKFLYNQSGRNLDADIATIEKSLQPKQPKQTAKPSAPVGGYNYATANAPFDFTSNTDAFRSQGEKAMQAYADGMNSKIGAINTAGNNAFNSGLNGVGADGKGGQMFYNTAANEAYKFAMGISSTKAKNDAYNSGAALSYQGDKGARWWISDWINAGNSSGQGYIAGVKKNERAAKTSGETIGKAALRRLKEYLGIHSPSTAFGEAGINSVEGYAQYMERYSYLASNAAKDMANSALKAVETANATLSNNVSVPTTTNAGYGIGVANQSAMMNLASNIYNAVVSGIAGLDIGGGDTVIMIDGKEVFRVVKKEERKSGIPIGNGAFV